MKNYFLILCLLAAGFAHAQEQDWKLKKDADGIKVYTRPVEGEAMNETKAVTKLNASLSATVAMLIDVENFHSWSPSTKSSRLLEQKSATEIIYYVETEAPWPVSDRDGIYTMRISQEPSGLVKIVTGCLPDYLPENKGLVRIPKSEGSWIVKPLGDKEVELTYQNLADPGGSIPDWVANSGSVGIPYKMLKRMSQQVQKPQYQNKSFSFLK